MKSDNNLYLHANTVDECFPGNSSLSTDESLVIKYLIAASKKKKKCKNGSCSL